MSRARSRPTREETRDRLLRAAAQVFSDKGIGDTSIEDICDAAEFSRGAFYSNFSAKDDLVLELLDAHMQASTSSIDRLFANSDNTTDFIDNMESDRRERNSPLDIGDSGILYIELMLYALRKPANRSKLVAHQSRLREDNKRVVEQIVEAVGRDYPISTDDVVSFVMALDLGLALNQLVDPDSHRPNQFSEFMGLVHRLWLAAPLDAFDDPAA